MDPVKAFKAGALLSSAEFLKGRKDLRDVDVLNEWRLLMTKESILIAVQKCADYINGRFAGLSEAQSDTGGTRSGEIVISYILQGAAHFYADLTERLVIPYTTDPIRASSYHSSQTQGEEIEILSLINAEKAQGEGMIYIIIDELFDNGFTLHSAKEHRVKSGVPRENIVTCTLFKKDRPQPHEYDLPDFCGVIVPNVWLVGYGLDDRQEKRGWKVLYACPKAAGVPKSKADALFDSDQRWMEESTQILGQLRV